MREEKSFSQRFFSIYTDIRKLQDKAKTSYTGIDITTAYIDYANEQAKKENLNAKFICQDIRTITFDKEFDVVLNMADGAIGYLEDDGENHKIFSVIAKALKNGGKHFMDIMNESYAQTHFRLIKCFSIHIVYLPIYQRFSILLPFKSR